jgi:hypothetical protein
MRWEPGYRLELDASNGITRAEADALFDRAGDAQTLQAAIAAYERMSGDPRHRFARLAEGPILYGAAHAQGKRAKRDAYHRGIRFAERALAENPVYLKTLDPADLGPEDVKAMLMWVTGVSYLYKECKSGFGYILYYRWALDSKAMIERLLSIDRGAEHGAALFSQAIYQIGLPKKLGGDLEQAAATLAEAESLSPGSLLIRWGRARYLYGQTGDRAAQRADLRGVLDPANGPNPYAWNPYFQEDARRLLKELEP